jgi:putative hemolysin
LLCLQYGVCRLTGIGSKLGDRLAPARPGTSHMCRRGRSESFSQEEPEVDDGGCIRTLFTIAAATPGTNGTFSSGTSLAFDIILILFFIFVNGFFSGTEMAVINANDNRLRREAEDGNRAAKKLLYFMEHQTQFLATIQIGVTFAGFLSSAFAGDKIGTRIALLLDPTGSKGYIQTLALIGVTLVVSYISLVLGELVPKQIAISNPEGFAKKVVGILRFFNVLFYPVAKMLNFSTRLVLKLFRIDNTKAQQQVTEEEIRMMLVEGRDSGNIQDDETIMIENIFEFNDKEVSEIMTHRTHVTALSVEATFEEVVDVAVHERFSRIPVYEDNIDDIVGVFHIKDLLFFLASEDRDSFNLRSLIRPPYLTPETKHVDELFREMQSSNVAIAVVIDEYGGTSGIVTIEDLLEEIVGSIQDEYDEEQSEVVRVSDNVYIVEGLTSLDDLERYIDAFHIDDELDDGDFDTVAGLVLDLLGRIPDEHDHPIVEYKNYVFQVMRMDDNRIDKIKLSIRPPEEETENDAGRNGS